MKMKISIPAKAFLIASAISLVAGCVERQVVYRDRPAAPQAEVVVEETAPPPPQAEVVTIAPDPTYIWIGGGWEWQGRWVWGPGRWAPRPHPGAVWSHGHWGRHGRTRVWIGSSWR